MRTAIGSGAGESFPGSAAFGKEVSPSLPQLPVHPLEQALQHAGNLLRSGNLAGAAAHYAWVEALSSHTSNALVRRCDIPAHIVSNEIDCRRTPEIFSRE